MPPKSEPKFAPSWELFPRTEKSKSAEPNRLPYHCARVGLLVGDAMLIPVTTSLKALKRDQLRNQRVNLCLTFDLNSVHSTRSEPYR
jgi:hypothetical protein